MKEVINKFAPVLKRVFHTNGLTTFGGLLCLVGAILLALKFIDKELAVEVVGAGTTVIGLGAKDGLRESPTVAPESLSAPDVANPENSDPAPTGKIGVAVVLLALAALTACAATTPPARHLVALSARQQPAKCFVCPSADTLPTDTLPASAVAVPPYLAAPPAGLSARQLRQFRRAQRQALIVAARTVPAKLKVKGHSANAAPNGVAVSQYKPAGPVGVGTGAVATDYSHFGQNANGGVGAAGGDWTGSVGGATAPKPPSLEQRIAEGFNRLWPWLLAGGAAWLLLVPIGAGGVALPLLAGFFRRRDKPTA